MKSLVSYLINEAKDLAQLERELEDVKAKYDKTPYGKKGSSDARARQKYAREMEKLRGNIAKIKCRFPEVLKIFKSLGIERSKGVGGKLSNRHLGSSAGWTLELANSNPTDSYVHISFRKVDKEKIKELDKALKDAKFKGYELRDTALELNQKN